MSKKIKTSPRKRAVKKSVRASRVLVKSSTETLTDIFDDLLRDIYWAEKHLVKALPKMARASYNEELQDAFESHLKETHEQITRLEKCFELWGMKPQGKKCPAMEGLVEEGKEAMDDYAAGHARDAALIAAAQKIEHYEISAYGSLRTIATVLGKVQCAELLEATKDEEAAADEKLTRLSELINKWAAVPDEER